MHHCIACVASVSIWFRSKERPVLAAREMKWVPFFARSLTLVLRSLLLNRTETLATQANHYQDVRHLANYKKHKHTHTLNGAWNEKTSFLQLWTLINWVDASLNSRINYSKRGKKGSANRLNIWNRSLPTDWFHKYEKIFTSNLHGRLR